MINKLNHKSSTEREAKYLPYKSYHNNKGRLTKSTAVEEQKSSTSSEPSKLKKSSKKTEAAVLTHQVSGYKGDNGALVENDKNVLKHSESQTTDASLRDYEKLEGDLTLLQNLKCQLDEENAQLKTGYEDLRNENENLRKVIASLELKNEELRDQFELNSDQIKEAERIKEEQEVLVKELRANILDLENEKNSANSLVQLLESEKSELLKLISELHGVTEEKDREVDQLNSFKKKWESYKRKLDRALIEKQELSERIANDAKFVQLLETDVTTLQQKNDELKDRNDQLQRCVTERKKNEELLRQKYDDLKKQNKAFKEKGSRYMLYDGINKYGSGPDSLVNIIGREDTTNKELRQLSNSLMNQLSQKSKKSLDSVKDQTYYSLLHRSNESERLLKHRKT